MVTGIERLGILSTACGPATSGAPWEPTLGLLSFKNWANLFGSLCLIKPMPAAVEGQVLNHWAAREAPCHLWFCVYCFGVSHPGLRRVGRLYALTVRHRECPVGEREWTLWATPCAIFVRPRPLFVCVCVWVLALTVETSLLNTKDLLSSSIVFLGYCFW